VPAANLLGEVGGGFKIAMTILNNGRFGLAAGCVGGAKRLIRDAAAYATQHKQFNKSISEFGLIQKKFAHMALSVYAAESMTYMTCGLMDRGGRDYAIEAAMSKVFASEMMWMVSNECLQVMGGLGYSREYIFERFVRDSRINMIFEGTNEILRLFIALSGIQAPGKHLRELASALKDPLENYSMLLTELVARVRDRVINEELGRAHPKLKRAAVLIEEKADAFGQTVERMLRHHGKAIIDEQLLIDRRRRDRSLRDGRGGLARNPSDRAEPDQRCARVPARVGVLRARQPTDPSTAAGGRAGPQERRSRTQADRRRAVRPRRLRAGAPDPRLVEIGYARLFGIAPLRRTGVARRVGPSRTDSSDLVRGGRVHGRRSCTARPS
jgi:hypothetical protein